MTIIATREEGFFPLDRLVIISYFRIDLPRIISEVRCIAYLSIFILIIGVGLMTVTLVHIYFTIAVWDPATLSLSRASEIGV
jgi:hypothetical protein